MRGSAAKLKATLEATVTPAPERAAAVATMLDEGEVSCAEVISECRAHKKRLHFAAADDCERQEAPVLPIDTHS